jgi:[ribosomal protein S5]-alanine N-acetyltransferase
MLPDVITSERFRLRPFRLDDVEAVLEYATDEEWLRYLPIPTPYTRADAERFLATQVLADRRQHPAWAIEVDGRPRGGVNIRFFEGHRVGEFGYGVARALWGRGFATEAAQLMIDMAFRALPELVRVRATADARNVASWRVMEKLGMTREGLLRQDRSCRGELLDTVVYGLLRSEWRGR